MADLCPAAKKAMDMKFAPICISALVVTACAADTVTERAAKQLVFTEGRSVYVSHVATEQEGKAAAMSVCRDRGGTAVFSEIIQYRHGRTRTTAAHFDCTV
jgi:hypothetical protein